MFVRNLHAKYAKCVRTFYKDVPPELQITTEEIDAYFRACALYIWAQSLQPEGPCNAVNRLYTDSKVQLTPQEIEDWINFYCSNPCETISIPDFFVRILAFDRESGTDISRRFTEVQSKILVMCAEGILSRTFLDNRRIEWMCEQLAIICDQAEIGADGSRGETEPVISDEEIEREVRETVAEVEALFESIRNAQAQENDEREGAELNTGKEG